MQVGASPRHRGPGRLVIAGCLAVAVVLTGAALPTGVPLLPGAVAPAAAATTLGPARFGASTSLPGFGNPSGGAVAAVPCGGYGLTAITGFHTSVTDYLRGVTAGCSPVLSDGTSATVGPGSPAGGIGHLDPSLSETSACPAGALATGIAGGAGLLVDRVQLLCSPLAADGTLGPASPAPVVTGGTLGSPVPDQSCVTGSVAVGLTGRSGDGLDQLALQCAPLSFPVDSALRFAAGTNGAYGRVITGYDYALEASRSAYTLEADVRWDGTAGLRGIVSYPDKDFGEVPGEEGGALALLDGRPCLRLRVNSSSSPQQRITCAAASLPVRVWVHLAGSYDSLTSRVSVNGVTTSQTWPDAQVTLYGNYSGLVVGGLFGNATDASSAGFTGDLDNVRFSAGVAAATPLLQYTYDEGSGLTAHSSGSQSDDATLVALDGVSPPRWVIHEVSAVPDNTTWPTALQLTPGQSVDGALLQPGEARWYRFPVTPDGAVTVDVTGLPADYDVSLFKDIGQAFTSLTSTADLTRLSAEFAGDAFAPSVFSPSVFSPSVFSPSVFSPSVFSPSVFSPSVFSPSVFSPSVFSPSVFSPSVFSPSVFSPSVFSPSVFSPSVFSPSVFSPSVFSPSVFAQAYSSAQSRSLIAVSANDGTADESVSSSTWANTGFFYARVVGRDGASSPSAYHLRASTTSGACSTPLQTYPNLATVAGTPGAARTVLVTDSTRLRSTAAGDLATLAARESALASATGGVLVDLSTAPRIVALNAQADAQPGCPYAKNLVAQAAREIVNSYRGGNGPQTLTYVVLVGGDDVVPFFRYPDAAGLGPENGFVPPVRDSSASQASLRRNTFLSQDAYGAATDVSLKGTVVPVPDLAVGRLVETPTEISGTIANYLALAGGTLPTATSSLVTGYDFLTDAADSVAGTLAAAIPAGRNQTLITNQGVSPASSTVGGVPSRSTSWTATDLKAALLTGGRHDVTFLAGHFSANSALAADFSTSVLTTDLASAPAGTFTNTLVLSAGCHSGYNLLDGDGVPGLTLGLDWAQAFAQQGATLIAGTGYQYGDTDFLEYSERLYAGLATQLRTGTAPVAVGTALTRAKQEYLSNTPQLGGIHTKAVLEATLFGLPMLGVDLPNRIPAPTTASTVVPAPVTSGPGAATLPSGAPGLGLQVASLEVTPTLTTITRALTGTDGSTVTATYLSAQNGVLTNPAQPALPLVTQNVSVPGQVLRGVGLRSAGYTDTDGITPLTGAPATENNAVHAPFSPSAFFPPRLASVNYYGAIADPAAGVTRLSVTPAQHRSDAPGSSTDTLRAYSRLGLQLFYSTTISRYGGNVPALAAPPSISGLSADGTAVGIVVGTGVGSGVGVRVHVTGDPSAGIQSVWVTYTGVAGSPLHGTWTSVDLTQDAADSTLWSGSIPLPANQNPSGVRFVVQAVNGVGLVSMDDNGGDDYTPGQTDPATAPVTPPAPAALSLSGVPSTAAYGASLPLTATLLSRPAAGAGAPLAGRPVTFTVGSSSVVALTGSNGVASAAVPVVDLPGPVGVQAAFAGDPGAAAPGYGAAASGPSSLTVTKQPTALTVSGPVPGWQSGTDPGVVATLTAGGLPVRTHTVYLAVTSGTGGTGALVSAATRTTDLSGRVSLGPLTLAPGSYRVTATFGDTVPLPGGGTTSLADPVLAPSTAAVTLVSPAPVPPTLAIVSGSGQTGTAGQPFDLPLSVKALSGTGSAVSGATVTYSVTSGSATFAGATPPGRTATATTSSTGVAVSPALIAGTTAGPVKVTATLGSGASAPTVTFTETVLSVSAARSDLKVTLTAPASVARGATFTATVTVTNLGPNPAANLLTVLAVGPSLSVVSSTGVKAADGYRYTPSGLGVGASVSYSVTLKAVNTKPVSSGLGVVTGSAVPDPALGNNLAAVTIKLV